VVGAIRKISFSLVAVVHFLGAALAHAHSLPVGSSRWCFGTKTMVANVDLSAPLLAELPALKDGSYSLGGNSEAELQQVAAKVLQPYLDRKLSITVNEKRHPVKVDRLEVRGSNLYTIWLSIDNLGLSPSQNAVKIDYRLLFEETGNTHLNLAYLYFTDASGDALQRIFDFSQPAGQYSFDSATQVWSIAVAGSTADPGALPGKTASAVPLPADAGGQSISRAAEQVTPLVKGDRSGGLPTLAAARGGVPEAAAVAAQLPPEPQPAEVTSAATADSATRSSWSSFTQFLLLGIEHILTGYDHIAFLVALIVIGLSTREVLKIITAFTVAHSITLLLAALQIVNLNSRFVESAIALSICYVALENLFRKKIRYRWVVTFCFGLIHGFGFASALQELIVGKSNLVLSVLSFNLGVETGQLMIFVLLLPVLHFLRHRMQFRRVTACASLVVFVLGFTWLVERVFDLKLLAI
jgi:hydrogenase/urease accessory protein HupE